MSRTSRWRWKESRKMTRSWRRRWWMKKRKRSGVEGEGGEGGIGESVKK